MPAHDGELTGRQPQAVHSALVVLEEVARCGPGVTAQQISANLGLPRATTYRLLNLLVQDEYLVRMPDLRGFALGHKVAQLAGVASVHDAAGTKPVIAGLRSRIRGGVHLALYRSDSLVPVDIDPDFPLSNPGRIVSDLSASALGRLLIAERASHTQPSSTRFTVQEGELTAGFGCLAVPVRSPRGALIAGVALALPVARLSDRERLLDLVRDSAAELGLRLGSA